MWHEEGDMGWGMLFGGFFWLALLAVAVYLVVSYARRSQIGSGGGHDGPIDIAKRRYASGKITRDEFERIRSDLTA